MIGYARVSTEDQDLTIQRATLAALGCRRIFEEKVSGARRDRPELVRMLDGLREGDVITVTRLDRMARSTRDLLEIVDRLTAHKVGLRSLAEPWADTTSAAGRMVMTVFAGIAEFERSLIRDRTGTGRAAAMAKGVRFGRPVKLSPAQLDAARGMVDGGMTVPEVASVLKVHPATLYRKLAA